MMAAGALPAREPGLLKPAVLWLLLLAPLFFSTYGFATWVTAQRDDVSSMVFDWERHMPFWAWTIVPYWSIDLLYGFSLLLPRSRDELKRHALRLLTAQVIAVSCFLLWPLSFTFSRPELDGVFGWLFAVLMRVATGSATVALTTASGVVAPVAVGLGYPHPELLVIATGAGSVILSHVNDGGFWLVKEYFNMTVIQTFKTWTVLETLISVIAFGLTLVLAEFL